MYSVHSGLILSRADTRNEARAWMVAHIPVGAHVVVEPMVPDAWVTDPGRPLAATPNGARWFKYPSLRSIIGANGAIDVANGAPVNIEDYERTLSPALIPYYEQHGYCWVVTGFDQAGRAVADPRAVPLAVAYYAALAREGRVAYQASPYYAGAAPVAFNFDWTFDYYNLAYARPGPLITVYHLDGGTCAAGGRAAGGRAGGGRPGCAGALSQSRGYPQLTRWPPPPSPIEFIWSAPLSSPSDGLGRVNPNPVVGAVIADDDSVLGEGWHDVYGGAHAEVNAIGACAGADLSDATLYVSLEPCCHDGQTSPCTTAIIAAGIARVVVASDDPTEKASGRGLGILRDEGIEVVVADGELAARARLLNQAFRKHARTGGRGCCSSRR